MVALDMIVRGFIKKWLNIPSRGVTDVGLLHPYLLNIKQPSSLYMSNHINMKMKGDCVVNAAIMSQVSRDAQWTNKSSTAVTCENIIAKCVENGEFTMPTSEKTTTMSIRSKLRKAKTALKKSINSEMLDTNYSFKENLVNCS